MKNIGILYLIIVFDCTRNVSSKKIGMEDWATFFDRTG